MIQVSTVSTAVAVSMARHLGLHRPDQWCVVSPGAGFTTTHGYAPKDKVPDKLPAYQESCLRIYDAIDYAENAYDVPIVAYSGEDDKQKKAADEIEELAPRRRGALVDEKPWLRAK